MPDLFIIIHKTLRLQLFELARDAARVDVSRACEVDDLAARLERTLLLLEEHATHEDGHVMPLLARANAQLAAEIAADHRALDVVHHEVARAADALTLAEASERPDLAAQLGRLVNHLVALHLVHMGREEAEVMPALLASYPAAELAAVHGRIVGSIPPAKYAEWQALMAPALSPVERALVLG